VATTSSTTLSFPVARERGAFRNLAELLVVFAAIMAVLWLPTREQLIFGPLALLAPLAMVLSKRPGMQELGLGWRGFVSSLWILPAAVGLTMGSVFVARSVGTYHPLYDADFRHVYGYVLWTLYQQFLLQDYFMPRLTRILTSDRAIAAAATLFAAAHLPNLSLTLATLVWGAVSCLLFRRYRSLYVLGLAQGLLGLCFAVCVPDAMHHHMRVGLGYLHYHLAQASQFSGYNPGK
jgi:membrane protease YdiL (CAAX protease family)